MKCFILFAVLAVAAANTVGRSGWGSNSGGWGSLPSIQIGLDAAVAALGQGSANANQQILELAQGDVHNPAVIISSSGISAQQNQDEAIEQIAIANQAQGTSSTINEATVDQNSSAFDGLEAYVAGGQLASAEVSAGTDAQGSGEIAEAATTFNQVSNSGSGWSK